MKFSIFGCDVSPKIPVSDFYTFATGSNSQEESQTPNVNATSDKAASDDVTPQEVRPKPFATPPRDQLDVNFAAGVAIVEQIRDGS